MDRIPDLLAVFFSMHPLDVTAIALYLLLMAGLGLAFRQNQSRREFFTAGGSMGWLPVGLSVMATLFSSNSFVFYPSAAFGDSLRIGLSLLAFALTIVLTLFLMSTQYTRDWFSVWYWPIGFVAAMISGCLLSFPQPARPTEFTDIQIMKRHREQPNSRDELLG